MGRQKMTNRQQGTIKVFAVITVGLGMLLGVLFWTVAARFRYTDTPDIGPWISLHTTMAAFALGAPAMALAGFMLAVIHLFSWERGVRLIAFTWVLTMAAMTGVGVVYVWEMMPPIQAVLTISLFRTGPIAGFSMVLIGVAVAVVLRWGYPPATSAGGVPPRT